MNIVNDAMSASMPGTAKQFLGSVQPRPVGQMIVYVAILGLLPLIGSIIGWLIGWGSFAGVGYGILYAIVVYIGMVAAIIGAGFVVSMLSQGMLGKQVSADEAVTVVGLAATPVLIMGFLVGIVSWILGLSALGLVLGLLAWIYTAYLLYQASAVRYGVDKAVIVPIIVIVAGFVIMWIFSWIASSIVTGAIVGAVYAAAGGWGAYGNPNAYGGLY